MALGHHDALAAAAHGPDAPHEEGAGAAPAGHVHDDSDGGAESGHCGPCVACCAATAIAVVKSVVSPIVSLGAVEPHGAASPPEYLPELLDPPPLTLAA